MANALYRKLVTFLPKGPRQNAGLTGSIQPRFSTQALFIVEADNWSGVDIELELTILFLDPVDESKWHIYEELPNLTAVGNSTLIHWTPANRFLPNQILIMWFVTNGGSVDFSIVAETA